jgi:hypothetical protein
VTLPTMVWRLAKLGSAAGVRWTLVLVNRYFVRGPSKLIRAYEAVLAILAALPQRDPRSTVIT